MGSTRYTVSFSVVTGAKKERRNRFFVVLFPSVGHVPLSQSQGPNGGVCGSLKTETVVEEEEEKCCFVNLISYQVRTKV